MVTKQLKLTAEICKSPDLVDGTAVIKLHPKDYDRMKKEQEELNLLLDSLMNGWENFRIDELKIKLSETAVMANAMDLGFKLSGFLNFWRMNGFPKTIDHVADKFRLKKLEEFEEKHGLLTRIRGVSRDLNDIESMLTKQGLIEKGKVGDDKGNGKSGDNGGGLNGSSTTEDEGKSNGNGKNGIHDPFSDPNVYDSFF